jgi:PIN domain nuclease of toxin-antitoxin system
MTILLDTHTLIWFLDDDSRLPPTTKIQIESTPAVFISVASIWEIAIKINIGKLTLSVPFETLHLNLVTTGITLLPITFADTETYLRLPLHHRDPFDRILIAQAMNHALALISQDSKMDAYSIQRFWG